MGNCPAVGRCPGASSHVFMPLLALPHMDVCGQALRDLRGKHKIHSKRVPAVKGGSIALQVPAVRMLDAGRLERISN